MARNIPDSKRNGQGRAAQRGGRPRRDRRRFWIQLTAALLVLAMLLPVLAGVISVL